MSTNEILHDFGDGLVLRRARQEDTNALVEMQIHAFANPDTGEPDIYIGGWTRDLMSGKHPNFGPQDFLIVVDTIQNKIVSCMCLISQTWSMQGISFGVGRVEIVATDEAYRRRGLVREQFRVLHELSAASGELVQAITGIPHYYRQFGYEYAIELSANRESYVPQHIPTLPEGEQEKFRLRHPQPADLPFISELYTRGAERSFIYCERDLSIFEYEEFNENDPKSPFVSWSDIIETLDGNQVGIVKHRRFIYQGRHTTVCFEILPHFSWAAVSPFVMRELVRQAERIENEDHQPLSKLGWALPPYHPFFEIMSDHALATSDGYAWYIRVSDLPAFLLKIAPVLEKRIVGSKFRNYSGTLRMNFYRAGLEMMFKDGKLANVQPWSATAGDYGQSGFGNATFSDLTFLKLLFGYRSRAELYAMFPDCVSDGPITNALLDVLFPKQATHILPIH